MKYALVTGAYGGMGQQTVKLLLKEDYTVFALDYHIPESSTPPNNALIPIQTDISDEESVNQAIKQVSNTTKELDAIIHFAGIYMLDSLVEMKAKDFEKIMKVNCFGPFYVNKACISLLKKGSRIIITTSELAPLDPLPFTGIYAVSKAALDKYAYSLAMEVQLLGIKVSVLRAGAVATSMLGTSTTALDNFCANTKLYQCNAKLFKQIVDNVEAKHIEPSQIAKKINKILKSKNPAFAYSINRNPLLLLLNVCPKRFQLWVIGKILKTKTSAQISKEKPKEN